MLASPAADGGDDIVMRMMRVTGMLIQRDDDDITVGDNGRGADDNMEKTRTAGSDHNNRKAEKDDGVRDDDVKAC